MNKLVYTEEQDLRVYESLPPNDFKEFFMAYFNYRKGDKIEITSFSNPVTFALFNHYIPKLDKNEDVYNARVANGKKGGRPKKNVEIENKPDLNTLNFQDDNSYCPNIEMPSNSLKTDNTEIMDIDVELNQFINDYRDKIVSIIDDFNSGSSFRINTQGKERLNELLNTYYGKKYKEKILTLINNKTQYKFSA